MILMKQVITQEPDFNKLSNPWLIIVKNCLEKDSQKRFSAAKLLENLAQSLASGSYDQTIKIWALNSSLWNFNIGQLNSENLDIVGVR